nr:hypothetical protein [Candidatus Burkholderia verschuerenii]
MRASVLVPVKLRIIPSSSMPPATHAVMPGVMVTTGCSCVPTNRFATKPEPKIAVVAIATITQDK